MKTAADFKTQTIMRRVIDTFQQVARRARFKSRVGYAKRVFHQFLSSFPRLLPNSSLASYHRRKAFQTIYREKLWGTDANARFFSGHLSHSEPVSIYVDAMVAVISAEFKDQQRNATIVDLGCGDFSVGERLLERLPTVRYVGCDLVPELIEHHCHRFGSQRVQFQTLDMVSQELPDGDICLIRQVFQHLANRDISCVLPKLRKYQALFVTEAQPLEREGPANPEKPPYADMRFDGRTGRGRGVELDQPPWNLTIEEICRASGTGIKETIVTHRVRA